MAKHDAFMAALKDNKRWADGGSAISILLVVCLLPATALIGDYANADLATRIGMYVIMAAVIIVVCIWQAAAFLAASVQMRIAEGHNDSRQPRS